MLSHDLEKCIPLTMAMWCPLSEHNLCCPQSLMSTILDSHNRFPQSLMYTIFNVHNPWFLLSLMSTIHDSHNLWCTKSLMYTIFAVTIFVVHNPWYLQSLMSTILAVHNPWFPKSLMSTIFDVRNLCSSVVKQFYEVQVYDEFVILGNTAVLKCHIPSFVREYVIVRSWVRGSDEDIVTDIQTGKPHSHSLLQLIRSLSPGLKTCQE